MSKNKHLYPKLRAVFTYILFFLLLQPLYSQSESVKNLLNKAREISVEDVALSGEYCKKALSESKKERDTLGIALSRLCLARFNLTNGEVDKAIELINQAIPVFIHFDAQSNLADAYSLKSIMVGRLNEYNKAIEYLNQAIVIFDQMNDQKGLAKCYINLAVEYIRLERYEDAIEMLLKSDKISSDIDYETNSFYVNLNLGNVYLKTEDYQEAQTRLFNALEIARKHKMKDSEVTALNLIGNLYFQLKEYALAIEYYNQCKDLAIQYNLPMELSEVMFDQSRFYKERKDYKNAMNYFEDYIALKDSMYKEEKLNKITELEKKLELREKENIIHQKNIELTKSHLETKHQKVINYIIIIASIILLVFLVFLVKGNREKRIANKKLEEQRAETELKNQELNMRNEEIESQRDLIQTQKEILEQRNQDILDSIKYAKRIQGSIIPDQYILTKYFREQFVLYRPKDIVSGDFYWIHETVDQQTIYFSVIDCTGHGIPGAFVSLVAYNNLNTVLKNNEDISPAKALNELNTLVTNSLSKNFSSQEQVNDGMDMVLCKFQTQTRKLECACANTSMYILSEKKHEASGIRNFEFEGKWLNEVLPTGSMIGHFEPTPYTQVTWTLKPDDQLVLFSDGYPDQFGGPKGKKINYKNFRKLLATHSGLSLAEQKKQLKTFLEDWKKEEDQIDDICIMSVKL